MDPDNYEIPNHFKKTPMTDPADPQFIESERRIYIRRYLGGWCCTPNKGVISDPAYPHNNCKFDI